MNNAYLPANADDRKVQIRVYKEGRNGTEYNIALFNLTFDENTEGLSQTELANISQTNELYHRTNDYLDANYDLVTRLDMDYENIDRRLPECKMLILCNPHNPGGTSWSEDELRRLADLCAKHHVIIVSDEIHADLTLAGHKHVMMASVSDTARDITVTMMAPTKAFNLPGVVASHTIIFNDSLRRRFFSYLDGNDLGLGNVFAYDCVCACYSAEGEEWLNEMLGYVQENISYVLSFLSQHCPKITAIRPEASFLVFLDNHKLGLESQKEIVDFYVNDARLFLNDGEMFGTPGRGYMRMNVAQPRCVIEKAMNQLAEAYRKRGFDK